MGGYGRSAMGAIFRSTKK
uniref:Uncharacterized protein n=1 Tax=Arundo donax TaxID=35708 RepID=A0A0A8YYG8_ARUDO